MGLCLVTIDKCGSDWDCAMTCARERRRVGDRGAAAKWLAKAAVARKRGQAVKSITPNYWRIGARAS